MDDVLHDPLEVGRGVSQPKWHPEPPELTPVAYKSCIPGGDGLKGDVVIASLEVDQAGEFSPPHPLKHSPDVTIGSVELLSLLVDWDQVLADPVVLAGLAFRHQHKSSNHGCRVVGTYWLNPLGSQHGVQLLIQPLLHMGRVYYWLFMHLYGIG